MIDELRSKFANGLYEFSKHAVDQIILRNISIAEILEAIGNGKIIESYPDDKYGPRCLGLGFTALQRPIHLQCTSGSREIIKVITVYEPDEDLCIEFLERRRPSED